MAGNMIKITDYDKVTPTKDDILLINQNGSNRKTTVNDLIGDVSTLGEKKLIEKVNENTSSLKEKANKNNSEFTGTMKLNNSNVVTEGTSFKHYAAVANPNGGSFVDVSLPDIINNFVVAQNGNSNITKLYVIGTYFEPTTKNTRIELSGTYTGAMQFNIVYK